MSSLAGFIVQESVHADPVSRHESAEGAMAAINQMVSDGFAEPGEFNVREINDRGDTVRVFGSDAVAGFRAS